MADFDDEQLQTGASGAADTYPQQCSALRKNGHVVMKGRPCKIVEMSTSKTGKHGHAKVHLVGIDIFTGKKIEDICPSTHNMDVPIVTRVELQICDLTDNYFDLMSDNGDMRSDLPLEDVCNPKELSEIEKIMTDAETKNQIVTATVVKAMGEEHVMSVQAKTQKN